LTRAAEPGIDLAQCREVFDESTDFTIGLEEEFAIVDPETLELEHRIAEL
jgi:glutamate---cysteine ligase / carboxylate-amine ligase